MTARYSRASSTACRAGLGLLDRLGLDPQGLAGAGHAGADGGPLRRRGPPRPAARRAARPARPPRPPRRPWRSGRRCGARAAAGRPPLPAASAAALASSVSRAMVKTIPGSSTPEVRGSRGRVRFWLVTVPPITEAGDLSDSSTIVPASPFPAPPAGPFPAPWSGVPGGGGAGHEPAASGRRAPGFDRPGAASWQIEVGMNPLERAVRAVDQAQQRFGPAAFVFGVIKKFGDDRAGSWPRSSPTTASSRSSPSSSCSSPS